MKRSIVLLSRKILLLLGMWSLIWSDGVALAHPNQAAALLAGVVSNCDEASLRSALSAGGTVTFSCDGTIKLSSSLVISTNTTLDATGHNITISGNNAVRVFVVNPEVEFTLASLTITEGRNEGFLGATSVSYGQGGAIYNNGGTVSIYNSTISNSSAVGGVFPASFAGVPAQGGAIFTTNGNLYLQNTKLLDNRAEGSDGPMSAGPTFFANMGGSGLGGAIYSENSKVSIKWSIISNNKTLGGKGGDGYPTSPQEGNVGVAGANGGEGRGSAIYNDSLSTLQIEGSTLAANGAKGGNGGVGGWGSIFDGNGGGAAGAIYNAGSLTLASSTISDNTIEAGTQKPQYQPSFNGGGIFDEDRTTTVTIVNSTLSGNTGGGIYAYGSRPLIILNTTLANNGDYNLTPSTATTIKNSILFNVFPNLNCKLLLAILPTGNNNLQWSGSFVNDCDPSFITPADVLLGPLANNGGPTQTMALLPGSAGIDTGDSATCSAAPVSNRDQRGLARSAGAACDIGAFELGAPLAANLVYHPLPNPVRLIDTRQGSQALYNGSNGYPTLAAGRSVNYPLAGATFNGITIPASAVTLMGNTTVVSPKSPGFLTTYPGPADSTGANKPLAASMVYGTGALLSNATSLTLGEDGSLNIYSLAQTDLVVDVMGYYAPAGTADPNGMGQEMRFFPLPKPTRLVDTRVGATALYNGSNGNGMLAGGKSANYKLAGVTFNGVTIPNEAKVLIGNTTVVGSRGPGFLTSYGGPADSTGANKPLAASMVYGTGALLSNATSLTLGEDGSLNIYSLAQTDLVVDVMGYYAPAGTADPNGVSQGLKYTALAQPVRLVDTRQGVSALYNGGNGNGTIGANSAATYKLAGVSFDGQTISAGAKVLDGNTTVVTPRGAGFLTGYAGPADSTGANRPLAASIVYGTGAVLSNATMLILDANGLFNDYSSAMTDVVLDVSGYFN